ncbi:MAG: diguanylate cyclase [Solirubrobacteraceae bacterium]
MARTTPPQTDPGRDPAAAAARRVLMAARRGHMEDPDGALAQAISCHELGHALGDDELCARALTLQAAVSLRRGDLGAALERVLEAQRHADESDHIGRAELAAVKAQLSLFTGSYAEALDHARLAVAAADVTGDRELRIHVGRSTCPVFGPLGMEDERGRIEATLALTIEAGDSWEEAIARNDLACYLSENGDLAGAEREIERAAQLALALGPNGHFALAVVLSTRADIHLLAGRPESALADADRSLAVLTEDGAPDAYVLAATVRAGVQARATLGRLDEARRLGEDSLARLGDRLPQTRSLILFTLASALREAGRIEDAYGALARSAELEREAFRELSNLQLRLDRALVQAGAARRQSEALAARNRQLAQAHAELERRAGQLEVLQEELRDQVERDWLTGVYNRRRLAKELDRLSRERLALPFSIALLDLDRFKSINDRFGHAAGDQVLVRAAGLLCDVLRETDTVIRSGGEEFLVLMPHTGARAAAACCARISEAIRDERWERIAPGLAVTTSVGLACTRERGDLEALIRLADQRLYAAKRAGRDRVVNSSR